MLSKLEIIAKVPDPTKFFSEIIKTPGEGIEHTVKVNSDRILIDSLEQEFQNLESIPAI